MLLKNCIGLCVAGLCACNETPKTCPSPLICCWLKFLCAWWTNFHKSINPSLLSGVCYVTNPQHGQVPPVSAIYLATQVAVKSIFFIQF